MGKKEIPYECSLRPEICSRQVYLDERARKISLESGARCNICIYLSGKVYVVRSTSVAVLSC